MGRLMATFPASKNDQKELMDSERLKNLICGNTESIKNLTVEGLFSLHQMTPAAFIRSSH
jgi:hypothetical protein